VRIGCDMPCVPRGSITDRLASRPTPGPRPSAQRED
jgi:hypothetical protein